MTDWEHFKQLPASERDELGFAEWRHRNRIGTHGTDCWKWGPGDYQCAMAEIERLRNASWKLGDALQDEQKKATKLQAEVIRLRGLLRDHLRATTAHHQSPNDMPIRAWYVRARDAALEALGDEP